MAARNSRIMIATEAAALKAGGPFRKRELALPALREYVALFGWEALGLEDDDIFRPYNERRDLAWWPSQVGWALSELKNNGRMKHNTPLYCHPDNSNERY